MSGEVKEPRNDIWYRIGISSASRRQRIDENFKKIGLMQQLSIIDRDLTAPPASPSDGDAYIPAATATGVWAAHENDIAIWIEDDNAWTFLTPNLGWICYVEDEFVIIAWNSSIWEIGLSFIDPISVADRNLTAPPAGPSDGDAYIPATVATGAWAGQENNIAVWSDLAAAWMFVIPLDGRTCLIVDEAVLSMWNGTIWTSGVNMNL